MSQVDYKQAFRELYLPPARPVLLDVPKMLYAAVGGAGNPNDNPDFAAAMQALYAISYGVKMLPKKGPAPAGYYEYTIFPLEGIWDLDSPPDPVAAGLDKDKLVWTVMIRQPDFVTPELLESVRAAAAKKKDAPPVERVKLIEMADGLSVQMMHIGPYDAEPASFALMDRFCADNGLVRNGHHHREIYLSDPRRTAPEKLRTVLRYFVSRK
ncbi:MAG: GyrI-like domain-containing protein [Chloroflexota bacterium]